MSLPQNITPADLQRELLELKSSAGLVALKAGTEVEDMTFGEIAFLRRLTREIVPLFVKIGGPEARNDMRACTKLGVDGLIAPMIESPFALEKFIGSLKQVLSEAEYKRTQRGINLETITAFQQLSEILDHKHSRELHQVTAARSDLSASMGRSPDADQVMRACEVIISSSRACGLRTSVGGAIVPQTGPHVIQKIKPDWVNTRHMVLSRMAIGTDAGQSIERALCFEINLYRLWASQAGERQELHQSRVAILERRLQHSSLIHT